MKLITERAIEKFEDDFDCLVTGDRYDMTLNVLWLSDTQFKAGEAKLRAEGIGFSRGYAQRTLMIKQSNLVGKVEMTEERVWLSAKNEKATPTSEMDHQRLSNCVGLLEVYLKVGKLSKTQGEDYLARLADSIIPEIEDRFAGELLPYLPHFPWEKDLLKEAGIKA